PTDKLSLSDIIHRFKTLTTKKYIDGVKNDNWEPFNKHLWQRSFHDHIIRNDKSLNDIREYIINNPATWIDDADFACGKPADFCVIKIPKDFTSRRIYTILSTC
ncbi:MAG: transposase, partial [Candidatus Omnitrophota bacterium]|nr:transposase [Candidatus Omnitrophota bacterium]